MGDKCHNPILGHVTGTDLGYPHPVCKPNLTCPCAVHIISLLSHIEKFISLSYKPSFLSKKLRNNFIHFISSLTFTKITQFTCSYTQISPEIPFYTNGTISRVYLSKYIHDQNSTHMDEMWALLRDLYWAEVEACPTPVSENIRRKG